MDKLNIFLYMAIMVYMSVEVIKGVLNVYMPELKVGLITALIFGILFTLGLGQGMVTILSGISYDDVFIKALFMGMDILTTGAVISLGSKGFNAVLEKLGMNIAGSVETMLDKK